MSSPSEPRPTGVIHDIGYRPYTGDRLGEGAVAWSLFRTGVRNCFGLGRSGRSKVLPMSLLGAMLLPAVILVAVLLQAGEALGLTGQIVPYSRYAMLTQVVISVFVAAQAPALISRDLRFRTITLYLARPLRRSTYVLVRLASLLVAVFALVTAPLLVLYLGGLLAELPPARETKLSAATPSAMLRIRCSTSPIIPREKARTVPPSRSLTANPWLEGLDEPIATGR